MPTTNPLWNTCVQLDKGAVGQVFLVTNKMGDKFYFIERVDKHTQNLMYADTFFGGRGDLFWTTLSRRRFLEVYQIEKVEYKGIHLIRSFIKNKEK